MGEKSGAADLNTISTQDSAAVNTWLASGTNGQVTFTRYDTTVTDNPQITPYQTNLRKRVAAVFSSDDGILNDYEAATHYSYDIEGNVKTLWQDIPALESIDTTGLKRIDYDYDIISGKVNEVTYELGRGDQFFYKYTYDADNRVIALETSRDGLIWHNDASYRYYLHGPLARLELGTDKVQGVDYAYTLQGWLKGVNGNNSSSLGGGQEGADMAQDGGTGIYAPFARDVYSLSLGYYNNDYTPIGGSGANVFSLSYTAPTNLDNSGNQLFNGNISNGTLSLSNLNGGLPVGYSYGYDQLNRITGMRQHTIANGATSWSNSNIINDYKEDVAYDANGNILKYLRNGTTQGGSPLGMDSLTYFYNANTNQLNTIHDSVPAGNYSVDIDNQNANNYAYDSIGNLMKDNSVGLSDVQWTVYGKIKQGTSAGITEQYSYDARNDRILKTVQLGGITGKQYYIRDAQGNVLAVYTYDGSTLKWAEQDLYGSSRVGLWSWNNTIPAKVMLPQSETDTLSDWYLLGSRDYELTNHLGNVLSVITDKKVGVSSGGSIVDYYKAEVLSQNDYYPFGMEEPGRSMSAIPYPYAFNGKRMENVELYISNQYDYGMRYYDARIGRFYSVDPLTRKYPELSPYAFAGNRPIEAIDLDGAETYLETQGARLQNEARLMNDVMIHQQQQQRQLLLQNRATVSPSDPCESCTVERTNAVNQARKEENYRQIIGPVGGGGPGFGRGMISDPIIQATAQGMLTTAIGVPFGVGMDVTAFSSFRAFGQSLISTNTLRVGFAKASADFSAQMLLNGFNLKEVNLTSVGSNFIFESPITTSFLGSFGQASVNEGILNTSTIIGGHKSIFQVGLEMGVNSGFGILGDKVPNKFLSKEGELDEFLKNLTTNYTSNLFLMKFEDGKK